jgi:hypothetical protein
MDCNVQKPLRIVFIVIIALKWTKWPAAIFVQCNLPLSSPAEIQHVNFYHIKNVMSFKLFMSSVKLPMAYPYIYFKSNVECK